MLKRTPLFAIHQESGARLVEFGGWEMPVQYTGIVEEHLAVRQAAGVFDISHMGQVMVRGEAALAFLNQTLTNDLARLSVGQGQYTLMCNERGGVVDDLYVYQVMPQTYLLILNASRTDADIAWLLGRWQSFAARDQVHIEHLAGRAGAVAVQGPRVAEFIDACFPEGRVDVPGGRLVDLKKNELAAVSFEGCALRVGRTGYTGEDGFEIFAPADRLPPLWTRLLEVGGGLGLKPCGLGARDTLRTEMAYPLYGHELDEDTTPLEAGLGAFVALGKGDFVGRGVLEQQKTDGVRKKCAAFIMTEKSPPPRPPYPIWSGEPEPQAIGRVASGTQSPSLNIGIGLGYVTPSHARPGTSLQIEVRGRRYAAQVVPRPIYKKPV